MSEWRVQIKKTYGRPIHGHVLSVREPYWTRYGNRNHRRGRKKIKNRKERTKKTNQKGKRKGTLPPDPGFSQEGEDCAGESIVGQEIPNRGVVDVCP